MTRYVNQTKWRAPIKYKHIHRFPNDSIQISLKGSLMLIIRDKREAAMDTERGGLLRWCFFLAFCASTVSVSQAQDSACLNQLVPCLEYVNSNKTPPSSCCTPLKSLISTDPQCLCSMLGSDSAVRQAGVNMTRAQLLPARCGERVGAASCKSGTKKTNTRTKTAVVSSVSGQIPSVDVIAVAFFSLLVQIM